MSETPLAARDVTVSYRNSAPVLKGVTFLAERGRLTALVGPNGGGKTTLLMTLAGLRPPETGGVALFGRTLYGPRALSRTLRSRQLAVVLTESLAPAFLRVREVVALGRLPHQRPFSGVSGADHRAIESSLDLTGTKTIESRRLTTLSDGELSRVMLARAIAQQPRVLLLDEPTGRLDPPHQTAFFVSLASLLERKVVESVVIATHHLHFALHFADEIGLVTEGAVYRAPPADLIVSHQLERAFLSRPDLRSSLALDPERGWFVPVDRS